MAVDDSELEFNIEFVRRVKGTRKATGWTQASMAEALGIPFERYKKYEQRSPLPHYLIAKFCELTLSDIRYLMTGNHSAAPLGTPIARRGR